jgi:hypothetical protein
MFEPPGSVPENLNHACGVNVNSSKIQVLFADGVLSHNPLLVSRKVRGFNDKPLDPGTPGRGDTA